MHKINKNNNNLKNNEKCMYIYGLKTVHKYLEKHCDQVIKGYISLTQNNKEIFNILKKKNIKIIETNNFDLTNLAKSQQHQSIVLQIPAFKYKSLNQYIIENNDKQKQTILMLHNVQNTQNLGAILRTTLLMGIDAVIIKKNNQTQITGSVAKASVGCFIENIIISVTNLTNVINLLKKHGFWIYSTNINKESQDFRTIKYSDRTVLLIGNENKGISSHITNQSDHNICIPSQKFSVSFNVSVACALMLFEIQSQKISSRS